MDARQGFDSLFHSDRYFLSILESILRTLYLFLSVQNFMLYGIRWKSHFHPINTIPFDLNRWNVSIRLKVFLNSIPIDGMLSCSVQNLSFGKERKGLLSSMLYNIRWKNYFYPIKTISRPKFDSFRWDTSLFCAKFEVWKRKKRILYSIVYSLEIASIRFQSTLLETISRSR